MRISDWSSDVCSSDLLTPQQAWGTWLASAIATGVPAVIEAVAAEARQKLEPAAYDAAKTAAAIMGMNNIYYRFVHLSSSPDYKTMPARLRMNAKIGRAHV